MRVLLVSDPSRVRSEIQQSLAKATQCLFEVVLASDLEQAVASIQAEDVDLVVLDLALAGMPRRGLVDRAHELAARLPVVLLSGTASLEAGLAAEAGMPIGAPVSERLELEEVDLPGLLIQTLRRARRLGTAPVSPVFCRLERTAVG